MPLLDICMDQKGWGRKFSLLAYKGVNEEQKEKIEIISSRTIEILKVLPKVKICNSNQKYLNWDNES